MANTKSPRIPHLDPSNLPDGMEIRQRISREQVKDENGDTVRDEQGNPVWERETVEVLFVADGAGEKAFRSHISDEGPEGYDGGMFVRDLLNNHLAKFPLGSKGIDTAPSTSYVDPLEAAQQKVANLFARGQAPSPEEIAAIYAEVTG